MEIYEYNNLSDPEQQRHALAALRQFNIDRNRMSLNEFVTYEPLFRSDTPLEQQRELSYRWGERVNLYENVTIFDADHPDQVIMTLPPMFIRVNAVNNAGPKGVQVAAAFDNANARPDEFDRAKHKYGELMRVALELAQDPQRVQKEVADAQQLMRQAISKPEDPEEKKVIITDQPSKPVKKEVTPSQDDVFSCVTEII